MRLPAAFAVFCLAMTAASPALACRFRPMGPDNAPRADLYRDVDTALVIATVVNGGASLDARLRIREIVYGRVEDAPLMLAWPDDPQYSYRYETTWTEGEYVIVNDCGRYVPELPVVERGQRVLAKLGVTQAGAQVVVRWWPLDDVRRDPRIAAFLAARRPAERHRLGEKLRPYPPSFGIAVRGQSR
jgi:hypothetical protein